MSEVSILANEEEWVLLQSGNVKGYVNVDSLLVGRDAIESAKAVLTEQFAGKDIFTLTEKEIFDCFGEGETVEEEKARLAAEEAARIAAEKAGNDALDTGDGVSASQMSIVYEITATQHKPEPKN